MAVGGASNTLVLFGTERFDRGSNFASSIFTAPVDGLYHFETMIRIQTIDSASSYYYCNLQTTNRAHQYIFDPDFGQDADYWTIIIVCLADMDAGDTAKVEIYQGSGTAQSDIQTVSHFSGHLVC